MTRFAAWILCLAASTLSTAQTVETPLERDDFEKLSSHSEMMDYLETIAAGSEAVKMTTIGRSVQGRDIPALFFSSDETFGSRRSEKVLVLISCQQHGNEPSGKEAALMVARQLAFEGDEILNAVDLILVPQVNPDGAAMGHRRNANDMDLNRNHAVLSEPETTALHRLFLEWLPEVTLDVHEYNALSKSWISNGFVKHAEEMLDRVTNLNIDPALRRFSNDVFIPETGERIHEDGFTFHRYIVGSPFDGGRIRHSTTAVNDGRQSMGIYNTLSFIFEGKRYGDLLTEIRRRTEGQLSAINSFLETVVQHRTEIIDTVQKARELLLDDKTRPNTAIVQMDYFPDPEREVLHFPVFEFSKWRCVDKELRPYEPLVRAKKSIQTPLAYIVLPGKEKLLELLRRHDIRMEPIEKERNVEVEVYTIVHVTPATEEDKSTDGVDVQITRARRKLQKGSTLIELNQPAANLLPLLLEPQSTWSLATEQSGRQFRLSEYLEEGREYPVLRLVGR
jgi:hypothetical protein